MQFDDHERKTAGTGGPAAGDRTATKLLDSGPTRADPDGVKALHDLSNQ
jgi:hypothetical protein